jgi:hypothetical protein
VEHELAPLASSGRKLAASPRALVVVAADRVDWWVRMPAILRLLISKLDVPAHPYAVAMKTVLLGPKAQVSLYP